MGIFLGNCKNFDELINGDIVLVDFYASWCGPCKMLSPILDELSNREDLKIVKVDVDKEEELARRYGVMSIPTLLLFKNGELVSTKNGFMPLPLLLEWIDSI